GSSARRRFATRSSGSAGFSSSSRARRVWTRRPNRCARRRASSVPASGAAGDRSRVLVGVLTVLAVLGGGALLVVLFLLRSRDGFDVSLSGLLRVYFYMASLAGVIVFAVGLAGILAYLLSAGFGLDVIYGGQ